MSRIPGRGRSESPWRQTAGVPGSSRSSRGDEDGLVGDVSFLKGATDTGVSARHAVDTIRYPHGPEMAQRLGEGDLGVVADVQAMQNLQVKVVPGKHRPEADFALLGGVVGVAVDEEDVPPVAADPLAQLGKILSGHVQYDHPQGDGRLVVDRSCSLGSALGRLRAVGKNYKQGVTNIRNAASAYWRRWLGSANPLSGAGDLRGGTHARRQPVVRRGRPGASDLVRGRGNLWLNLGAQGYGRADH
jgi:hypothetical protein